MVGFANVFNGDKLARSITAMMRAAQKIRTFMKRKL